MPNQVTVQMDVIYNNETINVSRTWDSDSSGYIVKFTYKDKEYIDSYEHGEITLNKFVQKLINEK